PKPLQRSGCANLTGLQSMEAWRLSTYTPITFPSMAPDKPRRNIPRSYTDNSSLTSKPNTPATTGSLYHGKSLSWSVKAKIQLESTQIDFRYLRGLPKPVRSLGMESLPDKHFLRCATNAERFFYSPITQPIRDLVELPRRSC